MILLIILLVLIVAAMTFMAGIVAILELAWPFLIGLGVIGLVIYILDRFGILPEKKKRSKNRRRSKRK